MHLHHALLAAVTAHHLSYTKLGCPCSNSVPALHTRVVIITLHILLAMNTSGLSWVKTDRQTQRPVREALNLYVYTHQGTQTRCCCKPASATCAAALPCLAATRESAVHVMICDED